MHVIETLNYSYFVKMLILWTRRNVVVPGPVVTSISWRFWLATEWSGCVCCVAGRLGRWGCCRRRPCESSIWRWRSVEVFPRGRSVIGTIVALSTIRRSPGITVPRGGGRLTVCWCSTRGIVCWRTTAAESVMLAGPCRIPRWRSLSRVASAKQRKLS